MFKFRVSFQTLNRKTGESAAEFIPFHTYAQAKRHYKSMILALYKSKDSSEWAICLNRYKDKPWVNPIFKDSTPNEKIPPDDENAKIAKLRM